MTFLNSLMIMCTELVELEEQVQKEILIPFLLKMMQDMQMILSEC